MRQDHWVSPNPYLPIPSIYFTKHMDHLTAGPFLRHLPPTIGIRPRLVPPQQRVELLKSHSEYGSKPVLIVPGFGPNRARFPMGHLLGGWMISTMIDTSSLEGNPVMHVIMMMTNICFEKSGETEASGKAGR